MQTVTFPKTADWQVYDSYTTQMYFTEDQHILKFKFNSVGTNLNWYQFDWKSLTDIAKIEKDNFSIYPNPASNYITVTMGSEMSAYKIRILSIDGKVLLDKNSKGNSTEQINISTLKKGMYILQADFNQQTINKTLIIK
jgi:hypothetical protein